MGRAIYTDRLSALYIATEDVQLAFSDAAIMTRLSIGFPVFLLIAIAYALKFFAANPEGGWDSAFSHVTIDLTRTS